MIKLYHFFELTGGLSLVGATAGVAVLVYSLRTTSAALVGCQIIASKWRPKSEKVNNRSKSLIFWKPVHMFRWNLVDIHFWSFWTTNIVFMPIHSLFEGGRVPLTENSDIQSHKMHRWCKYMLLLRLLRVSWKLYWSMNLELRLCSFAASVVWPLRGFQAGVSPSNEPVVACIWHF